MGKSSGSDSDRGRKRSKKPRDKRPNSRSRSPDSSSSRSSSRSRSTSKHQSRRRSKRDSRSRSPARSKRSRRSRSRSKEKSFKSHTKSSSRTSSYSSSSRSRRSNRSRSRSRSRDRKDSRDSKRERDDKSTQKKLQDSSKKLASPPSPSHDQNADDQLKAKLQMALKAAADADALLREQGVLTGGNKEWGRFAEEKEKSPPKEKPVMPSQPVLISEQLERAKALDNINAPGFRPQSFTSGKTNPVVLEEKLLMTSHDAAIFGTESEQKTTVNSVEPEVSVAVDKDSAAHENLFLDAALKEERWIKKLMYMRQRKLNGEAMF